MEKKLWYALMKDMDDSDWGTGTYDRDEAIRRMKDSNGFYTLIAVIDEGDGNPGSAVCVAEITVDEVS